MIKAKACLFAGMVNGQPCQNRQKNAPNFYKAYDHKLDEQSFNARYNLALFLSTQVLPLTNYSIGFTN